DGALSNYVATQDMVGLAVYDQLTKAKRSAVYDRARGGVETNFSYDDFAICAGPRLSQSHLRVLRIGEATNRCGSIEFFHCRATHRFCGRDKSRLNRLRDKHHPARNVAGGKNVIRGGLHIFVNEDEVPLISFNARAREV